MKREKPTGELLAQWLDESCSNHPETSNPARGLYLAWRDWLAKQDDPEAKTGSPRAFSNALKNLGFPWHRAGGRKRVHAGLRARLPDVSDLPYDMRGEALTHYANRYWC